MTSKLSFRTHTALALAMAGSIALASTATAQQVHQAEVAGAADVAAQVKAGEPVYQTVCMACHQADGPGDDAGDGSAHQGDDLSLECIRIDHLKAPSTCLMVVLM